MFFCVVDDGVLLPLLCDLHCKLSPRSSMGCGSYKYSLCMKNFVKINFIIQPVNFTFF